MTSFIERLERLKLLFKSIKDKAHLDYFEGPINPAVTKGILYAIENKLLIQIYYHDGDHDVKGWRLVQPYAYGLNKWTGNHVLRAYQISGPSYSKHDPYWRLFRMDRIFNIAITKMTWHTPTYLFNPDGDRGMSKVIAIVKFPNHKYSKLND